MGARLLGAGEWAAMYLDRGCRHSNNVKCLVNEVRKYEYVDGNAQVRAAQNEKKNAVHGGHGAAGWISYISRASVKPENLRVKKKMTRRNSW